MKGQNYSMLEHVFIPEILKQKLFLFSNNVDNDENNSNDDVSSAGDRRGDGKGVVRFEYAQRIHYVS